MHHATTRTHQPTHLPVQHTHFSLWQADIYIALQDFGSGESGDHVLSYLQARGFRFSHDSSRIHEFPPFPTTSLAATSPKVVYDVGANTGASAELIFSLWGQSHDKKLTLHSFEPVPDTFAKLTEKVKRFNCSSLTAIAGLAQSPPHTHS